MTSSSLVGLLSALLLLLPATCGLLRFTAPRTSSVAGQPGAGQLDQAAMDAWFRELQQTLAEVQMDGDVLVTTVTWAYIDFFENWWCSLKRIQPEPPDVRFLVFANDLRSRDYLRNHGVAVVLNPALLAAGEHNPGEDGQEMSWASSAYTNLMGERTKFLLTVLEEGYNVLTFDIDAVWEKNPLGFLDRRYDLVVVQEVPYSKLTTDGVHGMEVCGCFLYLVNTPTTRALMTETVHFFSKPQFSFNEQKVLGYLLQYRQGTPWEGVRMKFLPKPEFPNGREYYGYSHEGAHPYDQATREEVVVLHNNWVQGHSTKQQRWVEDGHWYVEQAARHGNAYTCRPVKDTAR
mmetsp:Transcript_40512/g.114752  ORF Transcript_40512/g.114752 Transcript_40512/m.114752 type:complete len:347 (+) Transcript_40512:306-1346(+)|eukprot:CAMPEP_0117655984 /NCGR_PEP_ID=MMETSP0804-20121206/4564_1 /TAXON_ID=1074897 /ORGANISM="Tetraselmis astigmatica, Strain CCMP880" /LENGTH=346 /DNA_ID=CAMNT_0005462359 /DNA_START=206 /DNA_END=1246 /DNA_ORIENTATION=+